MKTIRLDTDADGIVTMTFDEPDSAVNTMSRAWQDDLVVAVDRLVEQRDRLRGVILASAKPGSFFAGAQLHLVMQGTAADAKQAYADVERIKRCFRRLETMGKPVVACLNGPALGGGWEMALAAHARIAVDDAQHRYGTPEVTLGLIPGASGITKTVRLLGLTKAQPYLVEGRLFTARQGAESGLIHELVADASQLRERAVAWIAANPVAVQPWDVKGHKIPGGAPSNPIIASGITVASAMLTKKTRHRYPAPEACLAAMVEGAQVDFDTALRIESRHLAQVMTSEIARNMISAFFFDTQAIRAGTSRSKTGAISTADARSQARWKPQLVGILGAGMMGAGIAHAFASRGIACVLMDVSLEKATAGLANSQRITQLLVDKQLMSSAEQAALLARIKPTASANDLKGCDLIIEAVFEQRALKAQVTKEVEPMLAVDGVFASNTSTLPITGLATASTRPSRYVGLHFFSPVDRMPLVEIIRGKATSDETVARAYDVVTALGKTPIVVNDGRGFFTSRVFGTFVMEGCAMLDEGIPAAVIENASVSAGMPVGPLAVMDETSLSLSMHVAEQTRADLEAEGRPYEPPPGHSVIARMVGEFKRPGRAGGGGFYEYPKAELALASKPRKFLWPRLTEIFGNPHVAYDMGELEDRLLVRQAVETARCLHEGVLTSVAEANIGSIQGIGFPAWTGGALRYIYSNEARFFARAGELARKHGPRFEITPEVRATIERMRPTYQASG